MNFMGKMPHSEINRCNNEVPLRNKTNLWKVRIQIN